MKQPKARANAPPKGPKPIRFRDRNNTPKALLVLGMHRNGTSALTRVLNLLGADLPKKLLGPNLSNQAGTGS